MLLEHGDGVADMVEFTTGEDVLGEQLEFLVLLPEGLASFLAGRVMAWCR
jgi:hypothetical protein